jgi:hypothetical protein
MQLFGKQAVTCIGILADNLYPARTFCSPITVPVSDAGAVVADVLTHVVQNECHAIDGGAEMSLIEHEFTALRTTIASRGTVRIVLVPVTLIAWSVLATVILLFGDLPVAALLTLAVLVAGFEAVNALHVGVERIGRYVQVFHETTAGPGWETTAMAVGPLLPGGGVDPLFSVVFAAATLLNVIAALVPEPTPVETLVIGGIHAAFLVRIARARHVASRQRTIELARFQEVKSARDAALTEPPPRGAV